MTGASGGELERDSRDAARPSSRRVERGDAIGGGRGRTSWLPGCGSRRFVLCCAAIAAFSLMLRAGFPVVALAGASEDDALFVKLATSLSSGHWLGTFDNLTLVKGMFYPLFIAAAFLLHVPLKLAEQAVYLGACYAAAVLIRNSRPSRSWFPTVMFLVLALDPIMWSVEFARVIREGLYIGLTLLLVVLTIAITVDPGVGPFGSPSRPSRPGETAERPRRFRRTSTIGAGLLTGLVAAAYWLTREEAVWIVPTVGVVGVAGVAASLGGRGSRRALPDLALRWGGAAVGFAAVLLAVATTNDRHYGAFETTEVQSLPFRRAYGALAGIEQERWRRFVVFPRDARVKAYAVSPAAHELAPALEGASGEAWRQGGCSEAGEADCPEILAGWFQWALRDAVAGAGHYSSAGEAARYYDALADQIEAACRNGALLCLPPRATLAPPFRWTYLADAARRLPDMVGILFNLAFDPDPNAPMPASEADGRDLAAMSRIVGPVWPTEASDSLEGWIASAGSLPALAVETGSGLPAGAAPEVKPAPDVAAAFPQRRSERFSIRMAGRGPGDVLAVRGAGGETFPLTALTSGLQVERDGRTLHIDVGVDRESSGALPRWRRVAMAVARAIGWLYVRLLPPAFAAALLGCGLAFLWRRHARPSLTILLLLLASATTVCSRLALVSYLDVTAIPSANNLYPSPGSPFLLLFIGIGCRLGALAAVSRWTAWRARDGNRGRAAA